MTNDLNESYMLLHKHQLMPWNPKHSALINADFVDNNSIEEFHVQWIEWNIHNHIINTALVPHKP